MDRSFQLPKIFKRNDEVPDQDSGLENFMWLVELIRRLRPDLRQLFPLNKSEYCLKCAVWLLSSGDKEYKTAIGDRNFSRMLSGKLPGLELTLLQALIYLQRVDVRTIYPLPERTKDFIHWFYNHGVVEHNLVQFLTDDELQKIPVQVVPELQMYVRNYSSQAHRLPPFGVNLIGYAFGQEETGEDIRTIANSLLEAGIPFSILHFPSGKDIPQDDYSMGRYAMEIGKYAINIFCMTALEIIRYYTEKNSDQFVGRYNIGYWPWEVGEWPAESMDLFRLVDEIWVSSRYTYDIVAPLSPIPVLIMPLAVELGSMSELQRKDFGLPPKPYLFYFSSDLHASAYRKNFRACIKAFMKAFPQNDASFRGRNEIGLVIKVPESKDIHQGWKELTALAVGDDRIHIIEKKLTRPDLLALYKCCDCFLSLHRDENFGRGIVEALLLGLRVITTAYSGIVDLRQHPRVECVGCGLVPMQAGRNSNGKRRKRAEVDWLQVAASMRKLAEKGHSLSAECCFQGFFSPQQVGKTYSDRLRWLSRTLLHSSAFVMEKTA